MSIDLVSEIRMIDHHCHGVVTETLDRSRFAGLLSEGGATMHAEIDPADTPLGLSVRALCAPVLGLEPHVPFDTYLARRNELADANQRLLVAAAVDHLLIDTGYSQSTVLDPAGMARLGPFSTDEIVRIEASPPHWTTNAGRPSGYSLGFWLEPIPLLLIRMVWRG